MVPVRVSRGEAGEAGSLRALLHSERVARYAAGARTADWLRISCAYASAMLLISREPAFVYIGPRRRLFGES